MTATLASSFQRWTVKPIGLKSSLRANHSFGGIATGSSKSLRLEAILRCTSLAITTLSGGCAAQTPGWIETNGDSAPLLTMVTCSDHRKSFRTVTLETKRDPPEDHFRLAGISHVDDDRVSLLGQIVDANGVGTLRVHDLDSDLGMGVPNSKSHVSGAVAHNEHERVHAFAIGDRTGAVLCQRDLRAVLLPRPNQDKDVIVLGLPTPLPEKMLLTCLESSAYSDGQRYAVAQMPGLYPDGRRLNFIVFDFELLTTSVGADFSDEIAPLIRSDSIGYSVDHGTPTGVVGLPGQISFGRYNLESGHFNITAQVSVAASDYIVAAAGGTQRTVVHDSSGAVAIFHADGHIHGRTMPNPLQWKDSTCGCGAEVGFRAEHLVTIGGGKGGHFALGRIDVVDVYEPDFKVEFNGRNLPRDCVGLVVARFDDTGRAIWAANFGPWNSVVEDAHGEVPDWQPPGANFLLHAVPRYKMSSPSGRVLFAFSVVGGIPDRLLELSVPN